MRTIDLAIKDIMQILRDRRSLVFFLVMPVLFTFFFGFVFSSQNNNVDTRPQIAVVNHDPQGVLTTMTLDQLNASTTVRPVMVEDKDAASLDSRVAKEELAAALIIPQGFSDGVLNGANIKMDLIINEETTNGQTARRALQTTIGRVMGAAEGARYSLKAYEAQAGTLDDATRMAFLKDGVIRASQAWKDAPLSIKTTNAVDPSSQNDPAMDNPYNQYSPGMMVMFIFFGLMQAANVLVMERKTGAMARLLTTPMKKTEVIGGHILAMFVVFFLQQLLLVVFGQLVLKVDYLRQPLATLLVMVSLSLWVASTGLLIAALVKKEEQVVLVSLISMFLFSALGGAWFSLEMVGGAFAAVGHLTPSAWALDGYRNIIVRGQGLEFALLPAGIILAYSAAFFGIAVWKFKFE